jgi:hypothetical protein
LCDAKVSEWEVMVVGCKVARAKGGAVLTALVILASIGGAMAQDMSTMVAGHASTALVPQRACEANPAALSGELSGWNNRAPLVSAQAAGAAARLTLGRAVNGMLSPTPEVSYVLRPEKPGGSVSFGGTYTFTVPKAGHYRVALGSAAWIDVINAGNPTKGLTSIAHGHGPDCSGIRKMVDFALEPGDYILQISANAQAELPLLVTRLP